MNKITDSLKRNKYFWTFISSYIYVYFILKRFNFTQTKHILFSIIWERNYLFFMITDFRLFTLGDKSTGKT